MDNTQVNHVTSSSASEFQQKINTDIEKLESDGRQIIDIKYSASCIVLPNTSPPRTYYGALIISKK